MLFSQLFWMTVALVVHNRLAGFTSSALKGTHATIDRIEECVSLILAWQASPEVKIAKFNGKDRLFVSDELYAEISKRKGKYVLMGNGICACVYDSRDDAIAAVLHSLWD